MSIFFLFSYGV